MQRLENHTWWEEYSIEELELYPTQPNLNAGLST